LGTGVVARRLVMITPQALTWTAGRPLRLPGL